jgi:hypothetical protein
VTIGQRRRPPGAGSARRRRAWGLQWLIPMPVPVLWMPVLWMPVLRMPRIARAGA